MFAAALTAIEVAKEGFILKTKTNETMTQNKITRRFNDKACIAIPLVICP